MGDLLASSGGRQSIRVSIDHSVHGVCTSLRAGCAAKVRGAKPNDESPGNSRGYPRTVRLRAVINYWRSVNPPIASGGPTSILYKRSVDGLRLWGYPVGEPTNSPTRREPDR